MSEKLKQYSVSEVAKMLKVSPRTIRFYDEKNLVSPMRVEENGYRVYSEENIEKLKVILYLKELGFSLSNIKKLLNDKNGIYSLQLLITNQMELNESKISLLKENQNLLKNFERVLKTQKLKINNVSDATQIMMRDKKMTKLRKQIWIYTGCLFVIELLGIFGLVQLWKQGTNIMILVVLGLLIILAMSMASFLTSYYYHKVAYICPNCKNEFIPSFKNFFLAMHTPKFRKLCCPSCHKKSYCLEVIR